MITLIAAVAANGVIGRQNDLPWHIPEDLKHFKETTKGHAIIMGRNTWESFGGRALPGRANIVVSSRAIDPPMLSKDTTFAVAADIDTALTLAEAAYPDASEVFVAGGSMIYEQTLGICDRLLISHLTQVIEGDRTFPAIDPAIFEAVGSIQHLEASTPFEIVDYRRIR